LASHAKRTLGVNSLYVEAPQFLPIVKIFAS
jgi:hypothetical protein